MEIYFTIGLPGCGKTTRRRKLLEEQFQTYLKETHQELLEGKFLEEARRQFLKNWCVVSTDDLLEQWAKENGKTYSEVFATDYARAEASVIPSLEAALRKRQNIIVDRTNLVHFDVSQPPHKMSLQRKALLALVPGDYQRIAIVFVDNPILIEATRLTRGKDKEIPADAIERMRVSYQEPQPGEFHKIIWLKRESLEPCHRAADSPTDLVI